MSGIDPTIYKLSEKITALTYSDLLPFNSNSQKETREFLQKIIDILMDYVELTFNRDEPVLDFHQPECMKHNIDLEVGNESETLGKLVEDCAKVLKFQVKSGHPRFLNQLTNGLDIISMAGEWLAATANSNMFTYEVSPVFTVMEHVVLKKMRSIIGYTEGESVFSPGGTICNLYAVLIARFKLFPDVKSKGMGILPCGFVIFTSDQCHYSIKAAAAIGGIGTDNVIMVDSDDCGRIIPSELERAIEEQREQQKIPLLVCAMAGTTVFGAFDPLNEVAEICRCHEIWFHVDVS